MKVSLILNLCIIVLHAVMFMSGMVFVLLREDISLAMMKILNQIVYGKYIDERCLFFSEEF